MLQDRDNQLLVREAEIRRLKELCASMKRPALDTKSKRVVRNATKKLKTKQAVEFDVHSNFNSSHNQDVLHRVVEGAKASDEPISEIEATEAAKRHFRAMKQKTSRKTNGTEKKHRQQARRNSRMSQKKKFRLGGLNHKTCPLNAEQKTRAILIMKPECMSSDEDDTYTDEQGRECRTVREIPWESDEVKYYKSVTWNHYVNAVLSAGDAKRVQILKRDGHTHSDRKCPDLHKIPGWAIKL